MYRKPGSTITAVEIVASMYDGPIPADVLIDARAEDAAFRNNPKAFEARAALEGIAWNTRSARESIARIRTFANKGDRLSAETERRQILPAHLAARRQYRAQMNKIMKEVA